MKEMIIKTCIGRMVRHFKGKNYLVLNVAEHSETGELLVVYKALYGDCKVYVRPLEMFLSKVDKVKYPNVKQELRFELILDDGEVVTTN